MLRTTTRQRDGRRKVGDRTKTGETRELQLPERMVRLLERQRDYVDYKKSLTRMWRDEDYVFPARFGGFRDQDNALKLLRRTFPEWQFGFHALRHWFASMGLQSGATHATAARQLGHASSATTADVYGHLILDAINPMTEAVRKVLEP